MGQWVGSGHITKISNESLPNRDNSILFEDYKTPPPMGGCMGEWVGVWVGSGQMTNLIKLDLINIIQFCLKIYDLWRHPTYGWMGGLMGGLMSNH